MDLNPDTVFFIVDKAREFHVKEQVSIPEGMPMNREIRELTERVHMSMRLTNDLCLLFNLPVVPRRCRSRLYIQSGGRRFLILSLIISRLAA